LRYYYKIEHTPFTALFDKKGKLIASYRNETPVDELVKKIKALK
jgi:cytochrome oxidase Cu insertion factor (SCO1/SenC/PrrC family)